MDALSANFRTNMTLGQAKDLAAMARDVDANSVDRVSIDTTNYLMDALTPDGQDVLIAQGRSWTPLRQHIQGLMMDPAVKAEAANVELLNGTGVAGIAGNATNMLNELGLRTMPPGNSSIPAVAQSEIHDFTQGRDAATISYLAGLFGAKVVNEPSPSATGADIQVVLGKSYQGVAAGTDAVDSSLRPLGAAPVPPPAPAKAAATEPRPTAGASPSASASAFPSATPVSAKPATPAAGAAANMGTPPSAKPSAVATRPAGTTSASPQPSRSGGTAGSTPTEPVRAATAVSR
jgi:hypothetical protein